MTVYVAPIVEGQTEQKCIERLLHRLWSELLGRHERLQVLESFRRPRDQLVHANGEVLTNIVQAAALKLNAKSKRDSEARPLLLILLDAEADCPAALAPRLLTIARQALPSDTRIACVLAKRMFENWIIAGASTLDGVNGLPNPLPIRDQFEERNGVAWLEEQLRTQNRTRKYKKTADAEPFIRVLNLQESRTNSPSFDKLCRELESLESASSPDSESA